MRQLLDRMARLASGEGRPAEVRDADRAALALLGSRGVDDAERARLSSLCDLALRAAPTNPAERALAESIAKERQDALVALRAWFEEWPSLAVSGACHAASDLSRPLGAGAALACRAPAPRA